MLETVTRGFQSATERLRGVRELSEENIDSALRDVRMSLLEADVDLDVVRDFLARVKQATLGARVQTRARDSSGRRLRISPDQHFVRICEKELVALMGPVDPSLRKLRGATSVMLVARGSFNVTRYRSDGQLIVCEAALHCRGDQSSLCWCENLPDHRLGSRRAQLRRCRDRSTRRPLATTRE